MTAVYHTNLHRITCFFNIKLVSNPLLHFRMTQKLSHDHDQLSHDHDQKLKKKNHRLSFYVQLMEGSCQAVLIGLVWFLSFNGISKCRLFNAKFILQEEQLWYYLTHSWEDKGVHAFPKGIFPKVNVIARLEYELAYYDSAVHRFNPYTTRTPPAVLMCKSPMFIMMY